MHETKEPAYNALNELQTGRAVFDRPGLTVPDFFETISDQDVRNFLDPELISVLDTIFGGQMNGADLRRVAGTLIDFRALLADRSSRRIVLDLIPEQKQGELSWRVGKDIHSSDAWSEAEIRSLCDFFGQAEERTKPAPKPPSTTVSPEYGLFPHQRDAVQRIKPLLFEGGRAILHLPTGVGKTRTAMHIVAETLRTYEKSVVVWLASGKELLEQATLEFEQAWAHLGSRRVQVGTMWGDHTPNLEDFTDGFLVVGLAKGWSMISEEDQNWASSIAPRVRLVVFDEAHQSIAKTYKQMTEHLLRGDYRCSLLGLTATPGREWSDIDKDEVLSDYFDRQKITLKVPGNDPIAYLIDEGYLAKPRFKTLFARSGLDLSERELTDIANNLDIPENIIHKLSLSEQYVTAVLNAVEELIDQGHRRIIVFTASVGQAEILTAILLARNVKSYTVTGETSRGHRNMAINTFISDRDEPIVLSNFGVLTTGFDAPGASAVVIARPTKSLVLYSQMVGRAIRGPKVGGTKTCDVLTVIDPSLPGFGDVAKAFHNWEDVWRT